MGNENLLKQIKDKGLRLTGQRKIIVEIMAARCVPLTARQISEELHKKSVKVDRATIYRNLATLQELHLVNKLNFGGDEDHFEINLHHHHHLICSNCKKIIEIESDDFEGVVDGIIAQVSKEHDFEINSHNMEFYGMCKDCQK